MFIKMLVQKVFIEWRWVRLEELGIKEIKKPRSFATSRLFLKHLLVIFELNVLKFVHQVIICQIC